MCGVAESSQDEESLSNPVTEWCFMDPGRLDSSFSQQISTSIDQLLSEVRRDRAKRASMGENFQQMFSMLRSETRELR